MQTHQRTIINEFLLALANIFIFLPYFFSVTTLSRTLFSPWKNITTTRTKRGFSMSDIMNQISFNLISRFMGFFMRISLIIFYFIVVGLYMAIIPVITILFFIFLPFVLFLKSLQPSPEDAKQSAKAEFIKDHTLDPVHTVQVEAWYEFEYKDTEYERRWWSLQSLFDTPPLARDWAKGYTPTLDEYVTDLTEPSYQMSIREHIIGRDKETTLIERVLSQSEESNVVLVGEEGVGKHTIIDSFARKVYEGKTNTILAYKRILSLNMERMLTEQTDHKKREEFLETLLQEAVDSKNVILLIDNFDRYVTNDENRIDLSLPIEKYAKTANVQIIAITTSFAYEKYVYPRGELRTIFTKVQVEEMTNDIALKILQNKALEFEKKYSLTIPYETLLTTIEKSDYYINTIPFPEKALQLLDTVCVYTIQTANQKVVQPAYIDTVLSQKTHVPTTLNDAIKEKLLHLEELMKTKILGQDDAVNEVSSTIRRAFLLLGKRKKPLASFLFLGPTGVGKTETAKVISEVFFGTEKELIRFDMSLFQSKDDISKLIGSIETLNPGLLTNAIRENPYGVLLFDEIEKANHDLLNIFLTILDEGYFTDGYGQRVDCKNLIIVGTSNAGADHIYQVLLKQSIQNMNQQNMLATNELTNYLVEQHIFSPEFLNRFDGIIAYKPIQNDTAAQIAKGIIAHIAADIFKMYGVQLVVSEQTLASFSAEGYNTQYGVRNLERVLRQRIEDQVAKQILSGTAKTGDTIQL